MFIKLKESTKTVPPHHNPGYTTQKGGIVTPHPVAGYTAEYDPAQDKSKVTIKDHGTRVLNKDSMDKGIVQLKFQHNNVPVPYDHPIVKSTMEKYGLNIENLSELLQVKGLRNNVEVSNVMGNLFLKCNFTDNPEATEGTDAGHGSFLCSGRGPHKEGHLLSELP